MYLRHIKLKNIELIDSVKGPFRDPQPHPPIFHVVLYMCAIYFLKKNHLFDEILFFCINRQIGYIDFIQVEMKNKCAIQYSLCKLYVCIKHSISFKQSLDRP